MGLFIYGTMPSIPLEDRILAHLRIVAMNKLRRSEPFMLDLDTGEVAARRALWIHPAVPLQFHFHGSREPRINRDWIEELMRAANSAHGLSLLPEPGSALRGRHRTERKQSHRDRLPPPRSDAPLLESEVKIFDDSEWST
ncbi:MULTISPECIES: DUF7882 family protein [Microbacterium]|uniref:DUF7882 family protein n=1 Tax=Microbacterium paraoxydans TaxID=199592 RepID=UPI000D976258